MGILKYLLGALALCTVTGLLLSSEGGDGPTMRIEGSVEITRVLTKKRITTENYQNRGRALEQFGGPVADFQELDAVVVYWEDAKHNSRGGETRQLRQKNRRFSENLLVVAAGSKVSFPNDDPIFHNVFSLSKARSFDLGYFPQGQARTVNFPKPGVVDVFCHLHPNMSATILVTPNEYFARPGRDGKFRLADVPRTGEEFQIVAWHRAAGFFRKKWRPSDPPPHFVLPIRGD